MFSHLLIVIECLGIPSMSVSDKKDLKRVDRLILPGVGSFDNAIERLNNSGNRDGIEDLIFNEKVPIMGSALAFKLWRKLALKVLALALGG